MHYLSFPYVQIQDQDECYKLQQANVKEPFEKYVKHVEVKSFDDTSAKNEKEMADDDVIGLFQFVYNCV